MLKTIIEIARGCGQIILSAGTNEKNADKKSSWRDPVTVYDKRVQKYAVGALSDAFPGSRFIGEEGGVESSGGDDNGLVFVIDPIDGTLNFMHGFGRSCTSIACVKDGQPVIGVIYDPYRDEMFCAERGKGAFLNGQKIHVTDSRLEDTVVIFGTSPYNLRNMDTTLSYLRSVYGNCMDVRRTGSGTISEEYRDGHVPGAINIEAELCGRNNRAWIENNLPDKATHIYMYCFSGSRSGMAAAFLRQMGYFHAENIGGFKDYTGPVEQ